MLAATQDTICRSAFTGFAAALLLVVGLVAGCSRVPAAPPETSAKTVVLVIDYGDGAERSFYNIPWTEGMTVLDALKAGREHPRGITFEVQGSGAMSFLSRIDDLSNEGGGQDAKNWTFKVNGKLAHKGMGAYELMSGDEVVWRFGIAPTEN